MPHPRMKRGNKNQSHQTVYEWGAGPNLEVTSSLVGVDVQAIVCV